MRKVLNDLVEMGKVFLAGRHDAKVENGPLSVVDNLFISRTGFLKVSLLSLELGTKSDFTLEKAVKRQIIKLINKFCLP
jgi:hypothetical protein